MRPIIKKVLSALLISSLIVLAYLTFLVQWSGAKISGGLLTILIVIGTLKRGYKGLSTILVWVSFGLLVFAALWLEPMALVRGYHIVALSFLVIAFGLWDQFRLPK